jgi:hypothetical protein
MSNSCPTDMGRGLGRRSFFSGALSGSGTDTASLPMAASATTRGAAVSFTAASGAIRWLARWRFRGTCCCCHRR